MKYDKSRIMKRAWTIYHMSTRRGINFAQALCESWALEKAVVETAKQAEEEKAAGIVEMHYSEYKREYKGCRTVDGSYNKRTKTIKVYTNDKKTA